MILPETLQLAIAASRAKVRTEFPWWLRPFVMRGVIGITIGRRVYLASEVAIEKAEALLWHELAHVRQINRYGLLRFYWQYVKEYVTNLRKGMSSHEAYRNISFEIEANAAEKAGRIVDV